MLVGIQEEILRLHSMGLLRPLLEDKTTKTNILWATDAYQDLGPDYRRDKEMDAALITGEHSDVIKNRARKALEQQSERTRKHAEVFTPLWVCQKMVSHADAVWFGNADAFLANGSPTEQVCFPKRRKWQRYVDARRLEITCGEAPFLVNRYDAYTGEVIPQEKRQGILDRKLRVVGENAATEAEWFRWTLRAFQSTYGFEFQGDNLLIARVNLLMTFEEALWARWQRKPTAGEYRQIIRAIVWNLWQMDGLTGKIPYCKADAFHQISLYEWLGSEAYREYRNQQPHCRIADWRRKRSLEYLEVNKGGRNMKFDFVIGNPPYQEETTGDNKGFAPPIYNKFLDAAYQISDKVQGLKGSVYFGGEYDKLKWIRDLDFDLLIVDEAQEGVDTMRTERAFRNIRRKHTLYLSGTPFKALASEQFSNAQIYNWSYADEQARKENWDRDDYNPYAPLPRLAMFTYQLSNMIYAQVNPSLNRTA